VAIEFKVKVVKFKTGLMATEMGLIGYVDASTLSEFEQVLNKLIRKGAKNVILDCEQLEYINSTGLGLFLKYTDELGKLSGHLVLVRLPQNTRNVIELLGFDGELNISKDTPAALKDIVEGRANKG
jgi:anti-sigma B factor antagonist